MREQRETRVPQEMMAVMVIPDRKAPLDQWDLPDLTDMKENQERMELQDPRDPMAHPVREADR